VIYDFIIVGAGSAGAHMAYFLNKKGANVAVLDMFGIAKGASNAAGAFVSVRLGRGGVLQRYTNQAFKFSVDFYKNKDLFYQTGILRLPKDEDDAKKFQEYKNFLDVDFEEKKASDLKELKDYAKKYGGLFFKEAGLVDAKEVCETLLKDIKVINKKVENIKKIKDIFYVDDIKGKSVILATGAWEELLPKFLKYSKVAGFRFDVDSDIDLPYSVHKRVSISSKIKNKIIIGATHTRVDSIQCPAKPNSFLMDEAKKMVDFKKLKILALYCGVRASIYDHLPVIGEVIDLDRSIDKYPILLKGKKIDPNDLIRVKNLYIIGGLGGRGFVFGSFMAKKLVDFIFENKVIEKELNIDRIFFRYIKKEIA